MKIKSVRARVFQWKGKTVPPQGNFCSNAMDLLYAPQETMSTFRFHSWTVVEIETEKLGRLRFNVKDELKRTWGRETRLDRQKKNLEKA